MVHSANLVSQVVHQQMAITISRVLKGLMTTLYWDSRKQSVVDEVKPFGMFQRNVKCQTG